MAFTLSPCNANTGSGIWLVSNTPSNAIAVLNAPTPEPNPWTPDGARTIHINAASLFCSLRTESQSPFR